MKLYLTSIVLAITASVNVTFAQLRANNAISTNIAGQSAFLDASANGFSNGANNGKGLAFPRTDLTVFTFATATTSNFNFPTAYDGMIVYNTKAGSTPTTGSGVGSQTVAPGFYYFSNPTGGATNSYATSTGQWIAVGASPKVTIGTNEVATNTLINVSAGVDKQVYAIKGSFTTTGTSTSVTIPSPSGMTSLYGITIYKVNGTGNKVVYSRDLYSYNIGATNNAVTGSPSMSVVYPADTYDYVLEYIK
ncbi:hypothetical protein BBI01_10950 [Chryseobacterium artocarpi]|uniref:Uncharacterized protein n=1 Tax=Chryseobacterium artocarpi TaxID=1414727 RepID=A0A1B8ZFT7_9FLAO|nr:hypothetical protein [Chryseobacterium artocarpi]OCA70470.1 hypothetical protein BBI01_10950 [Chryseobacterium artocarpi]